MPKKLPSDSNSNNDDQSNKDHLKSEDYLQSENEAAELAMREEIIARIVALPPEMQIEAALAVMTFVMDELNEEEILALRKEITDGLGKEFGALNAFKTTIELIDGHLALRKIKKELGPDSAMDEGGGVDERSED